MELNYSLKDEILSVEMPPKIDTSNAAEFEEALNKLLNANAGRFTHLIFDAEKLNYISSVGLRALLKTKKVYDNFKIIGVNSEVFDIFDMTGFTQIIEIEKAFKIINLDNAPIIGEGFYGKVYKMNEDTIIKVYYRGSSQEAVLRERELAKKAFVMGLPTAISYDVVKAELNGNTYFGSVFEMINAESLRNVIRDNQDKFEYYTKIYADLLNNINSIHTSSTDIPRMVDEAYRWLKDTKHLYSEDIYKKYLELFKEIEDECTVIHGDCHVKNIFFSNNELILIDMDTLSKGNRVFELASIYLAYIAYELTEPGNSLSFLGLEAEVCRNLFDSLINKIFNDKSPEEKELIIKKIKAVGYLLFLDRTVIYDSNNIERLNLSLENINKLVPQLNSVKI